MQSSGVHAVEGGCDCGLYSLNLLPLWMGSKNSIKTPKKNNKHNAIKPLIPNKIINLEVLNSPAYINSSTTKFINFFNIMPKIIIEGILSN